MDTSTLLTKFARIGARLKVADRPSRAFRVASGIVSLDIREDRDGEFFEVARRSVCVTFVGKGPGQFWLGCQ